MARYVSEVDIMTTRNRLAMNPIFVALTSRFVVKRMAVTAILVAAFLWVDAADRRSRRQHVPRRAFTSRVRRIAVSPVPLKTAPSNVFLPAATKIGVLEQPGAVGARALAREAVAPSVSVIAVGAVGRQPPLVPDDGEGLLWNADQQLDGVEAHHQWPGICAGGRGLLLPDETPRLADSSALRRQVAAIEELYWWPASGQSPHSQWATFVFNDWTSTLNPRGYRDTCVMQAP